MPNPPSSRADAVGLSSNTLFPGRKTLYVHEVCQALRMSDGKVRALIEEGKLVAVDISGGGNRAHWRISIAAFDAFVSANLS